MRKVMVVAVLVAAALLTMNAVSAMRHAMDVAAMRLGAGQ